MEFDKDSVGVRDASLKYGIPFSDAEREPTHPVTIEKPPSFLVCSWTFQVELDLVAR